MSDKWIRITARIALITAIVITAISLTVIFSAILMSGELNDMLHGSLEYSNPDNPGDGWLALGSIFGSIIGGFAAAMLAAMGFAGVMAVILLGTPILIGWIVWKKTGNRKVYTICFIIPTALISLCVIISYLISFVNNFSILSINHNFIW